MSDELTREQAIIANRYALVAAVRLWLALPDESRADLVEELLREDESGEAQADEFISIMTVIGFRVSDSGASTSGTNDYRGGYL